MHIDRLQKDSTVTLQIVIEDKKYEIISRVAGTSNGSLLVETIHTSEGIYLLTPNQLSKAVYNMYANDSAGNRVGWYNVTVKNFNYKNHYYSGISTRGFNQNSVPSDRRVDERIRVDSVIAKAQTSDGKSYDVDIYDVSSSGISFLSDECDCLNKKVMIHIEDTVNKESFNLNINCTCVRIGHEDGKILCGCSIGEADRPYLNYIFDKKLEHEKDYATAEHKRVC